MMNPEEEEEEESEEDHGDGDQDGEGDHQQVCWSVSCFLFHTPSPKEESQRLVCSVSVAPQATSRRRKS